MRKRKSKAYITLVFIIVFVMQTVLAKVVAFEIKYKDNIAYAMEDKYITEEARFDIPYALTKYNIIRTADKGYFFVSIEENMLKCVYYNNKGNLVFGDAFSTGKGIVNLEGKEISLVLNKYNLSSFGENDLCNVIVTEDENYFYVPIIAKAENYTVCQIRVSKALGTVDESYYNCIFEIESELCSSFGALRAIDNSGKSVFIINIDKKIYEDKNIIGNLHEIYAIAAESKLLFSEEIIYSELAYGDLLRIGSVSHQSVWVNGNIYFVEGVKYSKHNETTQLYECILYSLGDTIARTCINEIVGQEHFIENGEYYSVHILPTTSGIACLFNYCDVKYEAKNMYTYYSAIASFSFEDLHPQYVNYYIENEIVETTKGERIQSVNYADMLNIDGLLTVILELREKAEDTIIQGNMKDLILVMLDDEGKETKRLCTRQELVNAEIKYGNTYMRDKLFVFDDIPDYDKYTETLPKNTIISFVSMGYGIAYMAEGLDDITTYVNKPTNVLEGLNINDHLGKGEDNIYSQYENIQLEGNIFLSNSAGIYQVNILCSDSEGRVFNAVRNIKVLNAPPDTNPPTGDAFTYIILIAVLAMVISLFERRHNISKC